MFKKKVLFEVLCAVNKTEKVEEVAPEIMAAANDVQAKKEIYAPYNILPLDSAGAKQSIMQLEEQLVGVISITEVWLQRCNRQIRGSDGCTDHRPFKVVRCCLEHAVSVARTFLIADAVVVEIKEPMPKLPRFIKNPMPTSGVGPLNPLGDQNKMINPSSFLFGK
ncbi:hypothetical protein CASFOL_037053 [Castilleja foliolosa]|uniref:Uncharacterized protein n=1 Tax=Castilleja foliolosa TaxID=1961234 RepID=A0ABD3BPP8_9LAMI